MGVFTDDHSARESEIWTDYNDLLTDARNTHQDTNSLYVILKPGTSSAFVQAIKSDGRLKVDALTEHNYYESQTKVIDQLRSLGLIVALTLGIGAAFGGMNTMYTAVARREREIGVLRVLGFSRLNILVSFVIESALLGVGGGIAGVVLAFLVAWGTGLDSRLLSVGSIFFSYRPTPEAITAGLVVATLVGVIGGLAPAWRAFTNRNHGLFAGSLMVLKLLHLALRNMRRQLRRTILTALSSRSPFFFTQSWSQCRSRWIASLPKRPRVCG